MESKQFIKLISSDDVEFEVEVELLKYSKTLT